MSFQRRHHPDPKSVLRNVRKKILQGLGGAWIKCTGSLPGQRTQWYSVKKLSAFLPPLSVSLSSFLEGLLLFSLAKSCPGEGNGTPLQYSCLENPMDGGAWWATVHGVAKSRTRLSDFTFTFHFHALEKEMATHSMFLPGESQGRGSLVGCRLWGHTESDTTEVT